MNRSPETSKATHVAESPLQRTAAATVPRRFLKQAGHGGKGRRDENHARPCVKTLEEDAMDHEDDNDDGKGDSDGHGGPSRN